MRCLRIGEARAVDMLRVFSKQNLREVFACSDVQILAFLEVGSANSGSTSYVNDNKSSMRKFDQFQGTKVHPL